MTWPEIWLNPSRLHCDWAIVIGRRHLHGGGCDRRRSGHAPACNVVGLGGRDHCLSGGSGPVGVESVTGSVFALMEIKGHRRGTSGPTAIRSR